MTSVAQHVPDPAEFEIGPRVREIRQRNGLSLRTLATALGISASALSQIETGRTRPSIQRVHEIATELNIPLSALFAPVLEAPQTDAAHGLSSSVSYDSSICVQKAVEAPTIQLENGIRWDRISPKE